MNISFCNMHQLLKLKGVENNGFMFELRNKELLGVNPFSDELTDEQKVRIIKECSNNIWYFVREIICRIDEEFTLTPLAMAMIYCHNKTNLLISSGKMQGRTYTILEVLNPYDCIFAKDVHIDSYIDMKVALANYTSKIFLNIPKYLKEQMGFCNNKVMEYRSEYEYNELNTIKDEIEYNKPNKSYICESSILYPIKNLETVKSLENLSKYKVDLFDIYDRPLSDITVIELTVEQNIINAALINKSIDMNPWDCYSDIYNATRKI